MKSKSLVCVIISLGFFVGIGCDCDNPVVVPQNESPVITSITASPEKVGLAGSSILSCVASDPDGDDLTYVWETLSGSINGSGDNVTWIAPDVEGICSIDCKVIDSNGDQDHANVTVEVEIDRLLYLKPGDPLNWTVQGGIYSQYEEIRYWNNAGLEVTTQDLSQIVLTDSLLNNYRIVRISNTGIEISSDAGNALFNWVTNGGNLFIQVNRASQVPGVSSFGVENIEGLHGGSNGLQWYYHGAPLLASTITDGPLVTGVNSIASASMDRTYLSSDHTLTIDATIDSSPAVVHGEFGAGKAIIIFFIHWSHDKTKPNNAYRADIFQADNIQFLENCIQYLKQ